MNTKPQPLASLVINLAAIRKNYRNLNKLVGSKTIVSSVVKSDAYGIGAKEVAKALFEEGCREFYVDDCFEGVDLRKSLKKTAKIFVFKGIFPGEENVFYQHELIPVLNNQFQIDLLENFARQKNKKIPCCLHVDTGMTRLGVEKDCVDVAIKNIENNGVLDIQYVISHLACADDNSSKMNQEQLDRFKQISKQHPRYKYSFANSAGIFLSKEMHFDQVRPGIALYDGFANSLSEEDMFESAISVTTQIINIYETKEPSLVGYSATYRTKRNQRIATIPVGYFNGIFRCLSNKGYCYINGNKAPYIGRISMGLLSVDLSLVSDEDFKVGQEVEIIGKNISLETIAKLADTINYEILTSLRNIGHKKYV
jgi:alanine racemase